MSGGFFRGTSADQDTRFSNKQAKLLKSQKFAPELDQLVDMTKVKMDVIRPWIATRATQLLGFEDEVLINFVYGLLDVKEVDGKQIQIQLTGFMEKNTGKFMKELWSLLLSAQKNASGVPQQFLDAKEEEARKKKVETDRITQEIQRKKETEKEGRELEREKQNKMDGEADISRFTNTASDALPKHSVPRASSVHPEIEREVDERHRSRTKNGSSHSSDHSPLSHRNTASRTRSSSKSFSKSRSYSEEGHKSGSVSVSSRSERHSISPKRRYRSPPRQSISPKRRYQSPRRRSISPRRKRSPRNPWSPSRRRQPRSKQRSHSWHRSPSPRRWRSPHARRRSPSLRRKSPSPLRHRSPSPLRRKSPVQVRRRSPSPSRQRSLKRRSLSPARRNSPSPLRRRSPPPRSPKYRRRSPLHSPRRRATDSQISPLRRKRSRSPYGSQSPSYRSRRSVSREHDSRINGVDSRRYRDACASHRAREKRSPGRTNLRRRGSDSVSRQLPISLRSPQRDLRDRSDINKREPVSLVQQEKTQNLSESPSHVQEMSPKENRRSPSLSENRMTRHDSPETSRDEEQSNRAREDVRHQTDSSCKESKHSRVDVGLKKTHANDFNPKVHSLDRLSAKQYATTRGHRVDIERREDREMSDMDLPERNIHQASNSSEEIEYGPGGVGQERLSLDNVFDEQPSVKKLSGVASSVERQCNEQALKGSYREGYRVDNMKHRQLISDECGETYHEMVSVQKSKKKVDQSNRTDHVDSASEGNNTDRRYRNTEKQRHKKPDHQKRDWDEVGEYDAQVVDRKEAKRRRKDEKRLRKEESRRRREERHRRRLERRAGKLNAESMDTVTPPSDFEKNYSSADESDGDVSTRKDSHPSETEEMESEQKKLEIELRKKALESLRAKKAISP